MTRLRVLRWWLVWGLSIKLAAITTVLALVSFLMYTWQLDQDYERHYLEGPMRALDERESDLLNDLDEMGFHSCPASPRSPPEGSEFATDSTDYDYLVDVTCPDGRRTVKYTSSVGRGGAGAGWWNEDAETFLDEEIKCNALGHHVVEEKNRTGFALIKQFCSGTMKGWLIREVRGAIHSSNWWIATTLLLSVGLASGLAIWRALSVAAGSLAEKVRTLSGLLGAGPEAKESELIYPREVSPFVTEAKNFIAVAEGYTHTAQLAHDIGHLLDDLDDILVVDDLDRRRASDLSRQIRRLVDQGVDRPKPLSSWREGLCLVGDVAEQVKKGFEPRYPSIVWRLRRGRRECWVKVDVATLERVFRELIRNSVEHGVGRKWPESGGVIEVTVRRQGAAMVMVTVEDNGDGIPHGERERVFDEGFRGEGYAQTAAGEDGRRCGGRGLGLHGVRRLVGEAGGSCRAEGSELGGASLVVELPRADDGA